MKQSFGFCPWEMAKHVPLGTSYGKLKLSTILFGQLIYYFLQFYNKYDIPNIFKETGRPL